MAFNKFVDQPEAHVTAMKAASCMRQAALMIALARTGQEPSPELEELVWGNVAAVGAEFYASADTVQHVLASLDPDLQADELYNRKDDWK